MNDEGDKLLTDEVFLAYEKIKPIFDQDPDKTAFTLAAATAIWLNTCPIKWRSRTWKAYQDMVVELLRKLQQMPKRP
jgi:hypothetical protein